MKKAELITALTRYARSAQATATGKTFARFLAGYFGRLEIPADARYDHWQIEPHIPQLLLGAVETFRVSDDSEIATLRQHCEDRMGEPFPNLMRLGSSNSLSQALTTQSITSMMEDVVGAALGTEVGVVLGAERLLLQQRFHLFLHHVYHGGLYEVIEACPQVGMSGQFGPTELRSFATAGRLMFTFVRKDDGDDVSFVCEEGDPLGLGGGLQSVNTDLVTAMAMIDDVVNGWPTTTEMQFAAFVGDEHVMIG